MADSVVFFNFFLTIISSIPVSILEEKDEIIWILVNCLGRIPFSAVKKSDASFGPRIDQLSLRTSETSEFIPKTPFGESIILVMKNMSHL